jgi:F-type H+-transporting ATPase subunit delta
LNNKNSEKQYKSDFYARSLFNLARAENAVDRVEDEMGQLKSEILNNLELKKYLTDSSIPAPEKIKSMLGILGEDASDAVKAAISTLIIMNVLESIEQIYRDYVALANQLKKQVSIEVISAVELDSDTIDTIKKDVDDKTDLDVRIKNIIDQDIIGGIVIKIGDRIIDLSLKNKIDDLKTKLKALELRGEDFGIEN